MRPLFSLGSGVVLRLMLALAFLIVLPVASARADAVALYRAKVPVAAQDPKSLQQGLSQALAQVLVKVGGQKSLLQAPAVQTALRDPNRFVLQFGYETGSAGASGSPLLLTASFQPDAIKQLLRGNRLPVWPENRPTLLVWLVIDDGAGRDIVGAEHRADVVQQLRAAAEARGIAITLPLLDLQDEMALGENELWQLQRDAVQKASQRYGTDTVLYGRLALSSGGRLQGSWQLLHRDALRGFDGSGADTAHYVQNGIDAATDWLAAKYAVVTQSGGGGAITLIVDDIDSYHQYAEALDYLQRLEAISQVMVRHAESSQVQFDANVSDVAQLQRVISLDSKLLPQAAAPGAPPSQLYFRWAGAAQ
jgi:uncharacterized protein